MRRNTEVNLALLIEFFGKDKLITDITDDDVTKLVAWRRGHREVASTGIDVPVHRQRTPPSNCGSCSPAPSCGACASQHEPHWRKHMLPVPQERVRELIGDEADRLDAAMRDDYAPFFAFARASGLRLAECLLNWSEVDWAAQQIRKPGKGGRPVTTPITSTIRAILWPLRGHHPEFVFTYVCERGEHGRVQRPALSHHLRQACRRTGDGCASGRASSGFRFHDLRHDFGTKLLRETGNLRLVQKALDHRRHQDHDAIRACARLARSPRPWSASQSPELSPELG